MPNAYFLVQFTNLIISIYILYMFQEINILQEYIITLNILIMLSQNKISQSNK